MRLEQAFVTNKAYSFEPSQFVGSRMNFVKWKQSTFCILYLSTRYEKKQEWSSNKAQGSSGMSPNCFQYYVASCNWQFTKHSTHTTCIVALLHIFAKLALIAEFRSVPIQCSALSNPWYICICVSFSMRICIRMWICIWMWCAAQNFTAWMLPPRWRCLPCLRIPQVSCAFLPPSQYLYFCISLTLIKGSCTSFPP